MSYITAEISEASIRALEAFSNVETVHVDENAWESLLKFQHNDSTIVIDLESCNVNHFVNGDYINPGNMKCKYVIIKKEN